MTWFNRTHSGRTCGICRQVGEKLAVSFRERVGINEPQSGDTPRAQRTGTEHEARIVRTNGDQLLSVVRNITERKLAEEALRLVKGASASLPKTSRGSLSPRLATERQDESSM
jgi:hypothetical protein